MEILADSGYRFAVDRHVSREDGLGGDDCAVFDYQIVGGAGGEEMFRHKRFSSLVKGGSRIKHGWVAD